MCSNGFFLPEYKIIYLYLHVTCHAWFQSPKGISIVKARLYYKLWPTNERSGMQAGRYKLESKVYFEGGGGTLWLYVFRKWQERQATIL